MRFQDARRLDPATRIEADICIVGAGAAGISLATELSRCSCRVALLESGGLRFHHGPQSLSRGAYVGRASYSLCLSRFRVFGGSTIRWTGKSRPLDLIDFQVRDWVPHSGWPFDYAHLEPYYRRAQAICGLGPYDYDAARRDDSGPSPIPPSGSGLQISRFRFARPLDLGAAYRELLEDAPGVEVYLNANVVEIEADTRRDRVTGLRVGTLNGRRLQARAQLFVLAGGGVENARLLLESDRERPGGLGNRAGLVGRFFTDHAYAYVGRFEPARGICAAGLCVDDFGRTAPLQRESGVYALSAEVQRREGLNQCGIFLVPRPGYKVDPLYHAPASRSLVHLLDVLRHKEMPDRRLGRHLRNVLGSPAEIASLLGLWACERIHPRHQFALRAQVEQTPNPASRVLLGRARDRLGMRRVAVDWRLRDDDKRGLQRAKELVRDGLEGAGIGKVLLDPVTEADGWPASLTGGKHHMGTTRMHQDPREGVVDPQCRVHELENLYLAGSSVFPSGGYANPTLTIVALAVRLADHLARELRAERIR